MTAIPDTDRPTYGSPIHAATEALAQSIYNSDGWITADLHNLAQVFVQGLTARGFVVTNEPRCECGWVTGNHYHDSRMGRQAQGSGDQAGREIIIRPQRCGGQATVGSSRIPVEFVAGVYWQHGMGQAEQQWEPYVDRDSVLLACWYMARYGTRTWRKRWAEWLETADVELWHTDPDRWADCPDPPTAEGVDA